MSKRAIIIGSGFASLSSGCILASKGWTVDIIEKNDTPGGRARVLEVDGFKFDMGPSWYWMPDVFERFFSVFNVKASHFYKLKRLDPSYSVFFEDGKIDIPSGEENVIELFESLEKGSGEKLKAFLAQAAFKYKKGIEELVYKPGLSLSEFGDWKLAKSLFKLDVFKSLSSHVRKSFKNKKLIQLLEFPVLFLGAIPTEIPALYSLMNYADISLGTWYPEGGMHKVVEGFVSLAKTLGVNFHFNSPVDKIMVNESNEAVGVSVKGKILYADVVIGGADYHHVEQNLLENKFRRYDEKYWDKKTLAPSSLIFYLGFNKKIPNLNHHNLFFDADFELHSKEIYKSKKWPTDPLFYVCCPSKSDDTIAPKGFENVFILIPTAVALVDTKEITEKYFKMVLERIEKHCGEKLKDAVIFQQTYAGSNFMTDYNSYKGNAYGLANTLAQTAILRPSIKSKKIKNLYYTGQLTVPGPGVPPAIISGQVVANQVIKEHNYIIHESTF